MGPDHPARGCDLGVLGAAGGDLTALMRQDEQIAAEYDQDQEFTARRAQVDAAIAAGAGDSWNAVK